MDKLMDRLMDGWLDGCIYVWMDKLIDR